MCGLRLLLFERLGTGPPRALHLILWGLLAEVLSQVVLPHTRGLCGWLFWADPYRVVPVSLVTGAELVAVNFFGAALSGLVTSLEMGSGSRSADERAAHKIVADGSQDCDSEYGTPNHSLENVSLMRDSFDESEGQELLSVEIPRLPSKNKTFDEALVERIPSVVSWTCSREPVTLGRQNSSGSVRVTQGVPIKPSRPLSPTCSMPSCSQKGPVASRRLSLGSSQDPCLRTLDAVKHGFVPVCTSYLAVVDRVGSLLAKERFMRAFGHFAAAFIGGPVVFTVSHMVGRRVLQRAVLSRGGCRSISLERRLLHIKASIAGAVVLTSVLGLLAEYAAMMPYNEMVGMSWQQPAEDVEVPKGHQDISAPYLWWQLPWGICGVVVALLAGDLVGKWTEGSQPFPSLFPGVNWKTAAQNAVALTFGHLLYIVEAVVESPAKLARLQKAHQTAGGTLSAYSGFVETVGMAAIKGDWQRALANLAVNSYLAAISVLVILQTGIS